jgi:hypothetical protein
MNTTPLWVPLVVAALGLVSTVVGIVVTQIMANVSRCQLARSRRLTASANGGSAKTRPEPLSIAT